MNTLLLTIALAVSSRVAPPAPSPPPAKAMVCGAPRALENDAVQTVRVCEFK